MAVLRLKRNDLLPAITKTLYEEDGTTVVDLTNGSTRFHMTYMNGEVKVDAAANQDDAAAGEVSYDWQVGDTDTAGTFQDEWEHTDSSGLPRTFPVRRNDRVIITGDLA